MLRAVALALTVLTGFSGLVYEVTWQRYLAILLGSHGEATAAVLGIFLGGLSVGYRVFGAVTRRVVERAQRAGRPPRLLLLYGVVEGSIGLYALAFPLLFQGVQAISLAFPESSPGLGFAVDVLLTTLLIGPPTVLMGGTIPVLTQALAHGLADATRVHAFVYAFNTAGAFLGALTAGFVLVPWLGLKGVMVAMGAANLVAGVSFLALGARARGGAEPAPAPESGAEPAAAGGAANSQVAGFAAFASVALLAGFAMMAIQTTLNRLGALAMGASQFTFAMVVAVFVLCIALGSFAVSALPRVRAWHLVGSQWLLVLLLYLLYPALGNATYWGHVLRIPFRSHDVGFYPYQIAAFVCLLAIFAIPIGLSGALLPLIFHHLRRTVGDLGSVSGRLYSWNTLGSLLGALLGGYALLFVMDLHAVYRLAVAALAVGATVLTIRLVERSLTVTVAFLLLPVLGALALQEPWPPERLSVGLFRVRTPRPDSMQGPERFYADYLKQTTNLFYDDGPTASIAVNEVHPEGGVRQRSILSNGKSDSSTLVDYSTTALIGLIPALFAQDCERSFVIGYGTGVTAAEIAELDCSREVVVAEIADGVIEAAPLFDEFNRNASKNPKIRIVRGDAYRTLLRSPGTYDVIASEPSNPWVAGIETLYSRDFLEAARARLRPGGVYAQWFHVYEMDEDTVALVLDTFGSVFEHASLWFTMGPDLLLLGFDRAEDATNLQRLLSRARQPDFRAGLGRAKVQGPAVLLAQELLPLGVIQRARLDAGTHTLLDPILSHQAARAFFLGGRGRLPFTGTAEAAPVGRRNSLLRRYGQALDGGLTPTQLVNVANQVCLPGREECGAILAWWRHRVPKAPRRHELLNRLRTDQRQKVPLTPELIDGLARFYDGPISETVTPAQAEQATLRFERFYHHAAPFERGKLRLFWERCQDGTPQNLRCVQGRERAERRLGPLGPLEPGADYSR